MNVILDCERMKYPYTGLFEYCHQLGLALLQTKEEKDHVDIYVQKKNQQFFPPDIDFFTQRSIHKFFFPFLDKKYEIWHATHQTSSYIPSTHRKIKRVLTIHDLNFLYEEKSAAKRASYLTIHQRNIDSVDHIIAISEFTKNDILQHLKVSKPITVIYNGCNVDDYPEGLNPTYIPKKPFLFALGTVNAKKNFHVLPCLLQNQDMELIIGGNPDPTYISKILDEAKKYKVEHQVKILGGITKEDKYWYYKHCKAFLFPSKAEGFGIPVIEAMRFGKPVFLSTATCLPEIGGKFAYYFEDFNPENMQKVFQEGINDYKIRKPEQSIIDHAKQFSWETSAKAYWKIYKSLAKG
ncbi:glycosyltransferase family 4 protein [Pedobacter sp.]|uniref:glycosyltransferase family 4 protein n=1 Tax=Pedobacter sp. TaxID=1411316 RepID=UPI003D7FE861